MTGRIKILETQLESLKRRVGELEAKNGVGQADLDRYQYEEALEHLANTGDGSLLRAYLDKKNRGVKHDF